ncbi:MAG: PspC domain-containing protein [Bacteroidia bacterium]|nr:PspC domain-containing protein [Bacteroidia bacterium]
MNKTLTVNIGGIVFHIEEQAFETLKKYLESIKIHFTTADGRDEIIQDIEARIAEMLQERISDHKQVITVDDVEAVAAAMGKPEQFSDTPDADAKSTATFNTPNNFNTGKRRLYRDVDDRVLGGVCAGIAHRFNMDPIWVRLVFFALIWGGGVSLWVYILLLIVVPKAITNAQKIEMRGEAVNLGSLANQAQTDTINYSGRNTVTRFFDSLGQIFITILKAFVYFFACIFGLTGIAVLISLFLLLLAALGAPGLLHPDGLFDVFVSPTQQILTVLAIVLVVGIPVFFIVYRIIKMLFNITTSHPMLRTGALVFWILGIVLGVIMIINIASEFSKEASYKELIPITQPLTDTLYLGLIDDPLLDEVSWNYSMGIGTGSHWDKNGNAKRLMIKKEVRLDIQRANGNEIKLIKTTSANGRTEEEAYQTASTIKYSINQHDTTLLFSKYFALPNNFMERGQDVRLVLKLPVGKSVYLGKDLEAIIYDIENVTNTWDDDMLGRTWTMTAKGLECIGCNLKDNNRHDDNEADEMQFETPNDAQIKIDSDGISIATKKDTIVSHNVTIDVNKNGVNIKTDKDR